MNISHIPVLKDEVIAYLMPENKARIVDGTLGLGGHTLEILKKSDRAKILGIDQDRTVLIHTKERLKDFKERIFLRHGNFSKIDIIAAEHGWDSIDGVLLDIGFSSFQLDSQERGFSFRIDGPLDMRMDISNDLTAKKIINEYSLQEISYIFRAFGEEKFAGKIAKAIVKRRLTQIFHSTVELAQFIENILPRGYSHPRKSVARCFQALRIAVNKELESLELGLRAAFNILSPNGRMVIISFHSLEDRIVKRFFKGLAQGCICPHGLPICCCNNKPSVKILTKKVLIATKEEISENSRSASAKLRAIEKL